MGFIAQNKEEMPELKYKPFHAWAVDFERKAFVTARTNRFGYTSFWFYWEADFEIKGYPKSRHKLVCQARRDLDKEQRSIHYTVYLPEPEQYPVEIIEWFKEAVMAYGLNGKNREPWLLELDIVHESVPDYYIEEAFVNERMPQDLKKKTGALRRTIDHKRDVWLCIQKSHMEYSTFHLYWHDLQVAWFTVEETGMTDEWGCFHQILTTHGIGIRPDYEQHRSTITQFIKDAIRVTGRRGARGLKPHPDFVELIIKSNNIGGLS